MRGDERVWCENERKTKCVKREKNKVSEEERKTKCVKRE